MLSSELLEQALQASSLGAVVRVVGELQERLGFSVALCMEDITAHVIDDLPFAEHPEGNRVDQLLAHCVANECERNGRTFKRELWGGV